MSASNPPRSPMDRKPDPEMLRGNIPTGYRETRIQPPSPDNQTSNSMNYGSPGSNRSASPQGGASYPPNHPLSGSKHLCSICGDRASGKHYGVYSCEGCKGFFKRTVRKELTYACRETRNCIIDKRQRNRCQYCRYMKCLEMGMRREAVQEERSKGCGPGQAPSTPKENTVEVETFTVFSHSDMPMDRIVEAEEVAENFSADGYKEQMNLNGRFTEYGMSTREKMLQQLLKWAKKIPHFTDLRIEDQIKLIRFSWNELMVAGYAFRSLSVHDGGILLSDGLVISRENAHIAGVGEIFDRIHVELIGKMKELRMEKCELGCLRAIVLFNPDARGLDGTASSQVESFREMVYATLEEHCRVNHSSEPSRFAKLLLRLPALRSIGLKCAEHTFFFRLIKEERPFFPGGDLRDLDGEVGSYNERNAVDSFMHCVLDES